MSHHRHSNPRPDPSLMSVTASEIRKNLEHEIRMELEYILSSEGLNQDKNISKLVESSKTRSVPYDDVLSMERLKALGVTKEDLLNAVSESVIIEINGDGTGIKRKDPPYIEEYEPPLEKKRKTQDGQKKVEEDGNLFEPKLYKITLTGTNGKQKEANLQKQLSKALGVDIGYMRLQGNHGYLAVEAKELTEADKAKLAHLETRISGVDVKIQECWDDDLDLFYMRHGKHLDSFLERSGRRRKLTKSKDEVDLLFYNKKFIDLAPLKYMFEGILSKNADGEVINHADHQLLRELITYHDNFKSLIKELKHFTVGPDTMDKSKRCFYAVRRDGEEMAFTFDECLPNLEQYYMQAREQIEVKEAQESKK